MNEEVLKVLDVLHEAIWEENNARMGKAFMLAQEKRVTAEKLLRMKLSKYNPRDIYKTMNPMLKKSFNGNIRGNGVLTQGRKIRAERAKDPSIIKKTQGKGVDSRGLTAEDRMLLFNIKFRGWL